MIDIMPGLDSTQFYGTLHAWFGNRRAIHEVRGNYRLAAICGKLENFFYDEMIKTLC